jgi:molybdopterin/thiamine biosynthesis adenylyltransferase
MPPTDDTRYSRQVLLFGKDGQRRLAGKRVAIMGLGGLGAHVALQLSYLGVRHFVLADGDVVTESSLNRLVGATEADLTSKTTKVAVAERQIRAIQPTAEVTGIPKPLEAEEVRATLAGADIVIGCLDDELARLHLLERASDRGIPYLDLATDTGEGFYGGRVLFTLGDNGCLSCRDELDQQELARAAMDDEQRRAHDRIYGIPRSQIGETGPSVISLNGVVASLGVTEFMVWATGLRQPKPHLVYRGDLGIVTQNIDPPRPDCYYCTRWNRPGT